MSEEALKETQKDENNISLDKTAGSDFSDDEFGDFEEVDQTEPTVETSASPNLEHTETISIYDGNYSTNEKHITELVDDIFKRIPPEGDENDKNNKNDNINFRLDQRATKIYDQLIMEEQNDQHIIWKKSMIFKQLMLNLDIPIEKTTQNSTSLTKSKHNNNNTEFHDLYEFQRAVKEDSDLEKIIKQVPDFQTLGIEKNSDEFIKKISDTTDILSNAQHQIDNIEGEKEQNLIKLVNTKKELLELLSLWDEKIEDLRVDNELFSSYVENLIGNTQKFRRSSKKVK